MKFRGHKCIVIQIIRQSWMQLELYATSFVVNFIHGISDNFDQMSFNCGEKAKMYL